MKKTVLLLLTLLISVLSFAQVHFEEGYYIDHNDRKINGFIKNSDWKNNPTSITFKTQENADPIKLPLDKVREFGIEGELKYIRRTVQIDRSSDDEVSKMDDSPNPKFKDEEVLLNVLLEGETSLYAFNDQRFTRYFYSTDGLEIKPLIYKRYLTRDNQVGTNELYKQQLYNDLQCDFSLSRFNRIGYNKGNLVKIFREYYQCTGEDYTDYEENKTRAVFHLNLRPGLNFSSLYLESLEYDLDYVQFDREASFRMGIEAELLLPFNKHKWAVFFEPTFQTYNSSVRKEYHNVAENALFGKTKYTSIEFPIGVRYYLYLTDQSKLFMNVGAVLHATLKPSNIELKLTDGSTYAEVDIESRPNVLLGVGYKFKDKYSLEVRYLTGREIVSPHLHWKTKYDTFSIIAGYTLF